MKIQFKGRINTLDSQHLQSKIKQQEKCLAELNSKILSLKQENKELQKDYEAMFDAYHGVRDMLLDYKTQLDQTKRTLKQYANRDNWDWQGVSFLKYNKGWILASMTLKNINQDTTSYK